MNERDKPGTVHSLKAEQALPTTLSGLLLNLPNTSFDLSF